MIDIPDFHGQPEIDAEFLQSIFAWSPTQVRKMDAHLRKCMKDVWPEGKCLGIDFYETLKSCIDAGWAEEIDLYLRELGSKQPKNKRLQFSLLGRLLSIAVEALRKISPDDFNEIVSVPPDINLMKPYRLLSNHGHQEFLQLREYLDEAFEVEEIDADFDDLEQLIVEGQDQLSDSYEKWLNMITELQEIEEVVVAKVRQMAFGAGLIEDFATTTAKLAATGLTLKDDMAGLADISNYAPPNWSSWADAEKYCNDLVDASRVHFEKLQSGFVYPAKILEIIKTATIEHRSNRTQQKLQNDLAKIIEELESLLQAEEPIEIPHEGPAEEWFDWALSLGDEALEKVQGELDKILPALSNFIGECARENLVLETQGHSADSEPEAPAMPEGTPEQDNDKNVEVVNAGESVAPDEIPDQDLPDTAVAPSSEMAEETTAPEDAIAPEESTPEEVSVDPLPAEEVVADPEVESKEAPAEEKVSAANVVTTEPAAEITSVPEPQQEDPNDSDREKLFLGFLGEGELDKAYWLSSVEEVGIAPDLVGALALGSRVGVGTGMPAELQTFLSNLTTVEHFEPAEKILLFSAILGSLLFSEPCTNELYVLVEMIESGIQPIDELLKYIKSEIIYKGEAIRPEDIDSAISDEVREESLFALKQSSAAERERNDNADFINYIPAKVFLRYLYREDQRLIRIHRIIETGNKSNKGELEDLLRQIDPVEIVSTAHTIGLKKVLVPITSTARTQLLRRINETLAMGRKWLSLMASGEQASKENVLEGLKKRLSYVNQSLSDIDDEQIPEEITTAASRCVDGIFDALDGEPVGSSAPLNAVLICQSSVELDDDLEPYEQSASALGECFKKQGNGDTEFTPELFETFLERNEFLRLKAVLHKFGLGEEWADRLEQKVEEARTETVTRISDLQDRVEDSYLLGRLDPELFDEHLTDEEDRAMLSQESVRAGMLSSLDYSRKRLDASQENAAWRIREINAAVDEIELQLSRMEQKHNSLLQEEFSGLNFPNTTEGKKDRDYVHEDFRNAIERGDNIAADELINRAKEALQKGERVSRCSTGENPELQSFIDQLDEYKSLLGVKGKLGAYIEDMKNRKQLGGIDFNQLDKAHLESVTAGMAAWKKLISLASKSTDAQADELRRYFASLDISIQPSKIRHESGTEDFSYFLAEMDYAIEECPIPTFGSAMGTRLNLVLCRNKKEPGQLEAFLKRNNLHHQPVFVLYLQEMSMHTRRTFQQYCALKKMPMLVLDLCLAFHLSSFKNRLSAFFKIALPMSWAKPYLMKGENVPRETFVGRDKEVASIQDPQGACIISGGRQLGKSALLRHVYRNSNDPNTFVVYLDIDGIGAPPRTYEQMQIDFWERIFRELNHVGFLSEEKTKKRIPEKVEAEIVDSILAALRDNPERQLFLLLDETDTFLDMDSSRDFSIVRRFKEMMAATDRRFKVVLAGLKSAQRYKNWKNHPFAQLGSDIVVRPLPPLAGQELVLKPMQALGFVFENQGLVLRILSQANYHPGLIQIFCYRLLEKLYERWSRRPSEKIMRTISLDDVQAIERNPDFIEDIRNRFDWTLDLDDRYKVIAYSLILDSSPTSPRTDRGFMDLAKSMWPQVFEKIDQQSLRAILDEMEGLGVLVREDEYVNDCPIRRYRLRSPNLLRLLGTRTEIEDELLRLINQDAPRTLNPRNFRSVIDPQNFVFGPFTKEQEGNIASNLTSTFGITTIFGSLALGLEAVPQQLDMIIGDDGNWQYVKIPAQFNSSPDKIVEFLEGKMKPRVRKHMYAVIDFSSLPATESLVGFANRLSEKAKACCTRNSRAQFYLLAPPMNMWDWFNSENKEGLLAPDQFNEVRLKRWSDGAITNALEVVGMKGTSKALGETIFENTRGWYNGVQNVFSEMEGARKKKASTDEIKQLVSQNGTCILDAPEKFGLEIGLPIVDQIVSSVVDYGRTDPEMRIDQETIELACEEIDGLEEILGKNKNKILTWLSNLDVIYPVENDKWRLNFYASSAES